MQARDDAYVLSRRPFRENSLLLHLFTRHHGRISCIAHASQKQGRILKSSLEPFRLLDVTWRGQGDVFTLIRAEERGHHRLPRKVLCYSLYLNELSLRLLYPQQGAHELFAYYQQSLHQLTQIHHDDTFMQGHRSSLEPISKPTHKSDYFQLILGYELHLLRLLGYELNLAYDDHTGQAIEADKLYYFSFDTGLSHLALPVRSIAVSGYTLLAIAQLDYRAAKPIRDFMDALLDQLLQGKKLNSRLLISF